MSPPRASDIMVRNHRLYHLGITGEEVAPNMILVGDPARAYWVAEHFDSILHEVKSREFVTLTGSVDNLPISVIGTGIGTDNVEIALIEAYSAQAFDVATALPKQDGPRLNLIRVGTSGGVQPDVAAGSLCVTEYALGLDATGAYYDHRAADPLVEEIEDRAETLLDGAVSHGSRFKGRLKPYAARATPELFEVLERHARQLDEHVVSGITVSSPGFYGASSRYIEGLTNTVPDIKGTLAKLSIDGRRVINFEMESSLLFHLAEGLSLNAGTICPVISQPDSHGTAVDYASRIERSIDIALAAMKEIAGHA